MARSTFEFSDRSVQELETVATRLQIKKIDVIRNALSLYAFLANELQKPHAGLAITDGDRIKTMIAVPGLTAVAVEARQTAMA